MSYETEVLVLGAGLAGQTAALSIAPHRRVLLVCKADLMSCASSRAQGGVSAVFREPDSHDKHVEDTLVAGAALNDVQVTRHIVESARAALDWLISMGVPFTREGDHYRLAREGGHSERRILHVDDATGHAIQETLSQHVRRHPNIRILEGHTAVKLLRSVDGKLCAGALVVDNRSSVVHRISASATVLATGGAGQIFLHATAPGASTGDGIALAWELGCRVSNLEFLQFHPTCMYYPQGEPFLITEAVRGEGGVLRMPSGHRFMPEYDARVELAPRDIVARAIYAEMKKHGLPAVLLDISHRPADFIRSHFPNIHRRCLERGIDITREPIPVTPASHYTCGGVLTDMQGRTDVAGLYCIGEAACTGFHGANRLASNSLLECIVMGQAAARDITAGPHLPPPVVRVESIDGRSLTSRQIEAIEAATAELRRVMWDHVGIVRSHDSVRAASRRIAQLEDETRSLYRDCHPALPLAELRSMLTTARLVLDCVSARPESRGCHFNEDLPLTLPESRPTVLTPLGVCREA